MTSRQGRRGLPAPRPFLKWAGGKGQLLKPLLAAVESAAPFAGYHEPFLGGGALFFELARLGRLPERVTLSDVNEALIECYRIVRDGVDALIERLREHGARHDHDFYYHMRSQTPKDPLSRAARLVYLNKTCFNGLYRENRRGVFNVPIGRYTNPTICDDANLRACSRALQGVLLRAESFLGVAERAQAGDFVYFDPPYVPLSRTASFTAYARGGFGEAQQQRLAEVFAALDGRGVRVLLSNSSTAVVHGLYRDFPRRAVSALRAVNSKAKGRGAVEELLIGKVLCGQDLGTERGATAP